MGKRLDYELEKAMDSAIMLLSQAFAQSGCNPKPVILHSIRVGMCLFDLGYDREIVLAGLLHDVLEDTELSVEALQDRFGSRITELVRAATFDCSISDKRERNRDVFRRCQAMGFDALVVKCADIFDNIDYFVPTSGYEELCYMLLEKYQDFLDIARDILSNEPLYTALQEKVHHVQQMMNEFVSE